MATFSEPAEQSFHVLPWRHMQITTVAGLSGPQLRHDLELIRVAAEQGAHNTYDRIHNDVRVYTRSTVSLLMDSNLLIFSLSPMLGA